MLDEQDPKKAHVIEKVRGLLTKNEEIEYVAVQAKPVVNFKPRGVVLTNRRVIVYSPRLLGADFFDRIWRDVHDVTITEGFFGSTIKFTLTGPVQIIDHIPKEDAKRLYAIAQEKEEHSREERRLREMEENRSRSSGHTVHVGGGHPPAASPGSSQAAGQDDIAVRLQKLKALADQGLITAKDYETKKAELLAKL
jgi:hypothetical protein